MRALGIETSCDETAAAVVDSGGMVVSSIVASQVDLHARFGGVVPEVAGRAHLELIGPVVEEALERAGAARAPGIDAIAATIGPGLIGSLLVGVSTAKALSLAWEVPFVGVNHLEGHLFAVLLDHPGAEWPLVVLLVSGGHTLLIEVERPGAYRLVGRTLDDAAGEAFDKVARYLDLGYPGGPAIEEAAKSGDPEAHSMPRALAGEDGFDMSFSGMKTAVVRLVRGHPEARSEDVAASFQQAVVDVLVDRAIRAGVELGARGVCLGGGVAANGPLRDQLGSACASAGLPLYLPSPAMCTDNAAMVAAAGLWQLERLGSTPLDAPAVPDLALSFLQGRDSQGAIRPKRQSGIEGEGGVGTRRNEKR